MTTRLLFLLALPLGGLCFAGALSAADFPVADFGAQPGRSEPSTAAIQRAIDAAADAGGGRVVFAPGVYQTGALFVKSRVELHLGEGVVLSAVRDDAAYPERPTRIAGIEMSWPAAVLNVYEQDHVRITGPGKVDGQGDFWWHKFWGPDRKGGLMNAYAARGLRWAADYDCKRVRAVALFRSHHVEVSGITIERPGFWSLSVTYCEEVDIDGVTIRANIGGHGPSTDGIDIDSSRSVRITRCDIDCNDDNICLKAGRDADGLRVNRPTEDIVIRDCITRTGAGAITFGSETSGGIRRVEVTNLRAIGTSRGVRFKSARTRGGVVEDIRIRGLHFEGVRRPFHFELDWYAAYSLARLPAEADPAAIPEHWRVLLQPVDPPERGLPLFRNIEIADVVATGAGMAFHANAFPEKPFADIRFRQVRIEAEKAGLIRHAVDWTMDDVVLTLPAGADNLTLADCRNVPLPRVESAH
jgi:polygalacturonase